MIHKAPKSQPLASPLTSRRTAFALAAGIAFLALLAHVNGLSNAFIEGYDDDEYVRLNSVVQGGFTVDGIVYAFTAECAANWHPLTMLSHMLDCSLFGLQPMGHHLTSLLLHSGNSALVFVLFFLATGQRWHSAAVAALFAVHPIHVESVALIAQRKDVLSGFFYLLALIAYVRYAIGGKSLPYWVALICALFAMLSKPTAVTLPVAMLLLDIWPLKRLTLDRSILSSTGLRLLLDKVPVAALALVSSVVTFLVQRSSGAVLALESRPLHERVANACAAYLRYIGKLVAPYDLSAYYGFTAPPTWKVAFAAVALLLATAAVVWGARKRPEFLVAWLWFLITMVPMIGIVQVGLQAMADRYAYITFLGLYIIVVWCAAGLARKSGRPKAVGVGLCICIALLTALSLHQTTYWRNAETLWARAIALEPQTFRPYVSMAKVLVIQGRYEEALPYNQEAARLQPDASNLTDVGATLFQLGRLNESENTLRKALALAPEDTLALFNLGVVLCAQKRLDEAEQQFDLIRGQDADFFVRTADVLANFGHFDRAEDRQWRAMELEPDNAKVWLSIGRTNEMQGNGKAAYDAYTQAKALDPKLPNIDVMIARCRMRQR